jgi:hypothetical protein
MSDQVCELAKNAREKIIFRLNEFKWHKFIGMRVFALKGIGGITVIEATV